jgi:adenylate kinase family enzyme
LFSSGKTTLGNKIKKIFGPRVIVYDTDNFIQPNTIEGKQLLKLEKEIYEGKKNWIIHKKLWKNTIKTKINEFVSKYSNKIIVFVGSKNFVIKFV